MIHSRNVQALLDGMLGGCDVLEGTVPVPALHSVALLSADTGSIISFSKQHDLEHGPAEHDSLNNLRIMALLVKDKFSSDEKKSCEKGYDLDGGHRAYTYDVEDLNASVTMIPDSDLLLMLLAHRDFPYGLLNMKLKACVKSFAQLYGYRLG